MRKVTILDRKFKSLLDELDYAPRHNRDLFIESRAQQVIASVTHLMKLIRESYNEEDADDLTKRLLNSIKTGDERKFRRGIKTIRESREDGK
jgi:predicted transcriptional regulator